MKLKKQKTNKLFFGVYPYKISTRVLGANLIRIQGLNRIKNFCTSTSYMALYKREIDKSKLLNFVNIFESFKDEHVKLRTEGDTANLFVKDIELYKKLQIAFSEYIVFVSEPENKKELQVLIDNKKYIICDELPKGRFKFRAILRSKMPVNVRKNLATWLLKYADQEIHLTTANLEALQDGKQWWRDCSIYVSDDKMLTLLALASAGYLRKTEEFVLRSSINNVTKGESSC